MALNFGAGARLGNVPLVTSCPYWVWKYAIAHSSIVTQKDLQGHQRRNYQQFSRNRRQDNPISSQRQNVMNDSLFCDNVGLLMVGIRKNGCSSNLFACQRRFSHYDTLGVTPAANDKQIKAAYYKLSMLYHPDKNAGDKVSEQKFRAITEAYDTLKNPDTRAKYDADNLNSRPIFEHHTPRDSPFSGRPPGSYAREQEPEREYPKSTTWRFHYGPAYKQDFFENTNFYWQGRRRRPPPMGKTDFYNFSEYYRAHYGEDWENVFRRERDWVRFDKESRENYAGDYWARHDRPRPNFRPHSEEMRMWEEYTRHAALRRRAELETIGQKLARFFILFGAFGIFVIIVGARG